MKFFTHMRERDQNEVSNVDTPLNSGSVSMSMIAISYICPKIEQLY